MIAASFPLFSRQMFENMGIQWASTLLGCVAVCLVPIPVAFYFYGKRLRMKSKFAPFFEPAAEAYAAEEEETGEESATTDNH
jgi:DHA1 family multidrug resistance protein-like MFS transporter